MTSLISAHESKDIRTFEKILKDNKKTISDDPFMRDYIEDLFKNIRTAVLLKIMKPYTQIRIAFLAQVKKIFFFLEIRIFLENFFTSRNWTSQQKKWKSSQ